MRKHYPWFWFDADGTLFDYDQAESQALRQTFHEMGILFEPGYLEVYRSINGQLWQALEQHELTPAVIPVLRFERLLEALRLAASPSQMSAVYLERLAQGTELVDGAYDVLQALQPACRFAIVTNGLQVVQRSRLARSAIRDFISELVISEEVGAAKPRVAFFEAAYERTGRPAKSSILLIGDSLTSDMRGGLDFGLDTCWFNPNREPRPANFPVTYEITQLRQLLEIVY